MFNQIATEEYPDGFQADDVLPLYVSAPFDHNLNNLTQLTVDDIMDWREFFEQTTESWSHIMNQRQQIEVSPLHDLTWGEPV